MPKIRDLLADEREIWLDLNEDNYRVFFRQGKEEGFVWLNGKEIRPERELFRFTISITKDGKIGGVNGYQRFGEQKKPKIYPFSIIN